MDYLQSNSHKLEDEEELEEGRDQCAICMGNFNAGDPKLICEMACDGKHIFHTECIEDWIDQGHRTCPLCRQDMFR